VTPSVDAGSFRIVVLSGAGGGVPDLRAFAATPSEVARFAPLVYPGWRRYADEGFSAQDLIRDLADEIAGWGGRVAILGVSLGGHLGYAVALRLQNLGVEVVGLCAVDSFTISSADIRPGSAGRNLARLRALARSGSLGRLWTQVRSLFWRTLLRMAGDRASFLLRRWGDHGLFRAARAADPAFEEEISMRLLIRATAPWLGEIDRNPVPLRVRAAHLRTPSVADSDGAWRARCPDIEIVEISGDHDSLFDSENFAGMRRAFASATRDWR
jgi:thioesterase domain-containing protein